MNFKLKLIFGILLLICIGIAIYYLYTPKIAHYKEFEFGLCNIDEDYMKPKIIKNIITKNEAQELINWARPNLKEAILIATKVKQYNHRNNKVAWYDNSEPIAQKIIKRIQKIVKLPEKNFEKIQICNYQPGEYFKHHQDQCHTNDEPCLKDLARGGQRLFNCLLYLNEGFEGGETDFPKLKKKFKLPIGDGVLWAMTNKQGNKVHPLAEHAGLPITSGEKWIANIWARKRIFV